MADSLPKRLELMLRRAVVAAAAKLARRPRRSGLIELPGTPRILLLRHDRLGDAIVSTASFKLLREQLPQARIEILLSRRNRVVASLLPAIDDTLELAPGIGGLRAIRSTLRARRYDVVVNMLAKDSASGALLTVLSGARYRVGFAGTLADIYDFAVPRPSRPMHIVPQTALLLAPFGVAPVGDAPRRDAEFLELSGAAPTPDDLRSASTARILFSISAPTAARSWPDERIVALVDAVRDREHAFTIAGTPADRDRVERIAAATGAIAAPSTDSYGAFIRQLAATDVVITPQTSTVHAASALRRPTVLLNTNSVSDRQWTPWGVAHRVVGSGEDLASIPVEDVVSALRSLVHELRASA
jgi:heptosyltransferase III